MKLRETGIYEFSVKKSLQPKGFGPEIDVKIVLKKNEELISMMALRGVFITFLFGIMASLFVIILEIIIKFSNPKFILKSISIIFG